MKLKIIAGVLFAIIAILIAGWFYIPTYVLNLIQKEYPGTTVAKIDVSLDNITLRGVSVNRQNLIATFDTVTITYDKKVHIQGGEVTVTLSGAKRSVAKKRSISAHGIKLTLLDSNKNVLGVLSDVSLTEDGEVWAPTGTATIKDTEVRVSGVKRTKDGVNSVVKIEAALPKDKFPINGSLTIDDAIVSKQESIFNIKAKLVGIANNKANNVEVIFKDFHDLVIKAETVTIDHKVIHSAPVVFNKNLIFSRKGDVYTANSGNVTVTYTKDTNTIESTASCSDWVNAFPLGLHEPLEDMSFKGDFGVKVSLDKPSLKITGYCRATCDSPKLKALRGRFKYLVYNSKGDRVERESGPGSSQWSPLPGMTALPQAVVALEDPNYTQHRGWIQGAFENSLKDNLLHKKFLRGGSTITMQLAKNLWLQREKTIGRKVQEVFLASAIESCFSKDDILELYLNVVEFGPDLYGIVAASDKYFHTSPFGLKPVQSFWLAGILPAPRKAIAPDAAALMRTKNFMKLLVENKRLPEDVLFDPEDE